MLVNQYVCYCSACNARSESLVVDLPVAEIKLVDTAMECKCGYFRVYRHTPIDFSSWRKEKGFVSSRMSSTVDFIESLIGNRDNYCSDSDEYGYYTKWIEKEQAVLASYRARDTELGNTPIPNILFDMVK